MWGKTISTLFIHPTQFYKCVVSSSNEQGIFAKATWSDYVKCSFKQVQEKYEFSVS